MRNREMLDGRHNCRTVRAKSCLVKKQSYVVIGEYQAGKKKKIINPEGEEVRKEKTRELRDICKLSQPQPSCRYNRAKMVDWMLQVIPFFLPKIAWSCYFYALELFDHYLSTLQQVDLKKIHIIGLTCIWIAMKISTARHPTICELLQETGSTKLQSIEVIDMEKNILNSTGYKLRRLKIYEVINTQLTHPLILSLSRQFKLKIEPVLYGCYRCIVLLYLNPITTGNYSFHEVGYCIVRMVMKEVVSVGKVQLANMERILLVLRMTYDLKDIDGCHQEMVTRLQENKSKFDEFGSCCYNKAHFPFLIYQNY